MADYQISPAKVGETERLVLRHLTLDDVPALTDILSDSAVMKYSVRGICDEAMTAQFIEWCLGCYVSYGVGPLALIDKKQGELIGFCGVSPEEVGDVQEMNLGYRLAARFWNDGYASEAAKAVLAHAFDQTNILSVVVIIEPEHVASLRVAEKAGLHDFEVIEFHGRSVRLYRLTFGGR